MAMKKESSPKLLGSLFLLLTILVFIIGLMVHYVNLATLPEDDVTLSLVNWLFPEYFAVGFFTAVFLVVGIHYVRQKGGEEK